MPTLRYIAHAAFMLADGDNHVLVDPFITGNPKAQITADALSPRTILLTHAHNDHVGDTIDIAKRTGAKVISTFELGEWLQGQGVENAIDANHGGTVAFDGGTVKLTPAWHTSSYTLPDGTNTAFGIPAGLIVRFGGTTIYFAGDTALFGDMQLIGDEGIDIAVLPIGDHYTMGPGDAVRATKLLRPKTVIPCHYNTFPPITQDEAAFKQMIDQETGATAVILAPGESLEL